jgi:signal transduction histidine kinase
VRISIKTKQVAGVTLIVGLAVVGLSALYLSSLVHVKLVESRARADTLANAIFQRARGVVAAGGDRYAALRADDGLRAILESSAYSDNVTYAAIVDVNGIAIAHSDAASEGQRLAPAGDLAAVLDAGTVARIRAIYTGDGKTLEVREPLFETAGAGSTNFGAIRIGISTLLIRRDLANTLRPAVLTTVAALAAAVLAAMLLAQLILRPIHLIRSGLTRLSHGEFGVKLDLSRDDEFGDLGESFNAVSARLSADRSQLAGQTSTLESVVEHLEDAVAVVSSSGDLLFANPSMRAALGTGPQAGPLASLLPTEHPYRTIVEDTLASGEPRGPIATPVPALSGDRLLFTHPIDDRHGRRLGVMLIARNLEYLSQVQSTLRYSRKLAALGRLSAGVAHEVKNPLNATMIHLELLKLQLSNDATTIDLGAALDHVSVIGSEMRRLDQVVQGFLKFTRPEDLKLQPVAVATIVREMQSVVHAEAEAHQVEVRVDCPSDLPLISADPVLLQQAFLNLALNAIQAMPHGGRLRIAAAAARARQVEVVFEDTGTGIEAEQLDRIFDLYFTTKERGSGIGLSMVYRTVQLHDGEIEVESVPGKGTTFRLWLPRT